MKRMAFPPASQMELSSQKAPGPRLRQRQPPTIACLLGLLAACASAPPVEPGTDLAEAERLLAAGEAAAARDLLLRHKVEALPGRLRPRHDLRLMEAHFQTGDPDAAFALAERFADRYPLSDLRGQVVELLWQIGHSMAKSGRGLWFFWSDRRSARTVLEHLIVRHPDSQRLADALRVLGDLAYEDQLFSLAQERYRDLLRRCPDSEWSSYARYRYAMSLAAGLRGPDYDLDQMEHAARELQAYVQSQPENPEFARTAANALQTVLGWVAERHLRTAHYYRTLGNLAGQRMHLERAARDTFFGTKANAEATAELATLPPAAPGTGITSMAGAEPGR